MALTEKDLRNFSPEAKSKILGQLRQGPTPRENKYHNQKDERGGIRFDSKKEARRYDELMLMLRAGKIRSLKLQPDYTLQEAYTTPEGERVQAIRYRADFSYEQYCKAIIAPEGGGTWLEVVEDVKGVRTEGYKLKRKLFREKYGFDITEV